MGRLEGIDRKLLEGPNERLGHLKKDLWTQYNSILDHEEAFWFQQARTKWIRLGDRNTRYFHEKSLARRRENRIEALLNEHDEWVYDDCAIQQSLARHFQHLFSTSASHRQPLHSVVSYPPIDSNTLQGLGAPVTLDEVKRALFSMGNYKSPGPDGFHPIFFKSQWEVVGPSIYNFVQQTFENPAIIGDINHTLLTPIPKVHDPSRPSDFRPIALCNVIYKIVTKVISNRIKPILPDIISHNQSSFITRQNATDNAIILQETVHSMHSMMGRKRYMVIKLDLAKAYDKMEWSFITNSLEMLQFPQHLIELIKACLSSSTFSINWQGKQTQRFSPSRGLRQGDPMSPLLFVTALERLSHCIQDAVNDGLWCPLKFGRGGPEVSYLLFANDILLIAEASDANTRVILDILNRFTNCSGKSINNAKSCVLFSSNTPPSVAASISAQLGIAATDNLGRYLGIPIIIGRKGKADFSFLIDKIRAKLSGWKAATLSQAGHISLAQSSIFSIPNYVMQTSKLPTSVCDEVERLCRDFIWGSTLEARKNHLISWDKICSPKENGGLGFRTLHTVNAAYLMKLGWGILTNRNALWVRVLCYKYGCGNLTVPIMTCGSRVSHLWRGICQYWPMVDQGILWIIKNGTGVRFWQDQWVPGIGPLGDIATVHLSEHDIRQSVSDYATQEGWNWQQLSNILPQHVCQKIASIRAPSNGPDDFPVWHFSADGMFSIKYAYDMLSQDDSAPSDALFTALWKVRTPPRINTFLWKLAHQRLMTNLEQYERGIEPSDLCPRCKNYPESIMHVLRDCEYVLELWEELVDPNVWHIFASASLDRWLDFNIHHLQMGTLAWSWPIVFATMVHLLWIDRNHFVFKGKTSLPSLFLPKVVGQVEARKLCPSFMTASSPIAVSWLPPPMHSFKLNSDGSCIGGLAAYGGLLRNDKGQFVSGFHCKLGSASAVQAELWGLVLGLRLARSLGISSLFVELDSKVVVTMVHARRTHCAHLQPVLEEALASIHSSNWSCSIKHIFWEANSCADMLANLGHGGGFQWTVLDTAPPHLTLVLEIDARGFSWDRLVPNV